MSLADMSKTPDDRLADTIAPLMFYLALLFLVLQAAVLVLWLDVPRVVEAIEVSERAQAGGTSEVLAAAGPSGPRRPLTEEQLRYEAVAAWMGSWAMLGLLCLWPIFLVEQLLHRFLTPPGTSFRQQHPYWLAICLLPPLRMCARHRANRQYIWFPGFGWQIADRGLQRRLERVFSVPMIWIALLILPVLGLQVLFDERIVEYPLLRTALHAGTGLIWFAFAVEFTVMVSVAEKKLTYCRTHWLDLVIILLPLISFLRTLRGFRAARMVKVGKLQQLSRLVRAYRVRGVAMRGLRALLLLDLAERLLRTTPEQRIAKLEQEYLEKQQVLAELREEIDQLRAKLVCESDAAGQQSG